MDPGVNIPDAATPTRPPFTSDITARDPAAYLRVVRQFEVETNPRYAPRLITLANGQQVHATFCNIFVWDCSRAMGAEVPHWVDADGNTVPPGHGHELNANAVWDWLAGPGYEAGWQRVQPMAAVALANLGSPVVVVWKNPLGGPGHVAMVIPQQALPGFAPAQVVIAQAGASNFSAGRLESSFGARPVLFYAHN